MCFVLLGHDYLDLSPLNPNFFLILMLTFFSKFPYLSLWFKKVPLIGVATVSQIVKVVLQNFSEIIYQLLKSIELNENSVQSFCNDPHQ